MSFSCHWDVPLKSTETAYLVVFSQAGEPPTFRPGSSHMSNISFNFTPIYTLISFTNNCKFYQDEELLHSIHWISFQQLLSNSKASSSRDALISLAFWNFLQPIVLLLLVLWFNLLMKGSTTSVFTYLYMPLSSATSHYVQQIYMLMS